MPEVLRRARKSDVNLGFGELCIQQLDIPGLKDANARVAMTSTVLKIPRIRGGMMARGPDPSSRIIQSTFLPALSNRKTVS